MAACSLVGEARKSESVGERRAVLKSAFEGLEKFQASLRLQKLPKIHQQGLREVRRGGRQTNDRVELGLGRRREFSNI